MGDRIAVMSEGVLQQVGTPQELYDHPVNRFVAGFIGSPAMNFVERHRRRRGDSSLDGDDCQLPLPPCCATSAASTGDKLVAGFRPEHLELGELAGDTATIRGTRRRRRVPRQRGAPPRDRRRPRRSWRSSTRPHRVSPGDVLDLKLPLEKLHLFDAATGDSIEARRDGGRGRLT